MVGRILQSLRKSWAKAKGSRRQYALPRYSISTDLPTTIGERPVTIVKCTTIVEADRVVKKLKRIGISARIPGKVGWAVTEVGCDVHYPSIPVQVRPSDYAAARRLLARRGGDDVP